MKNRICHITSVHSRYDGRIFQKECASLAQAGFEVFLLVNDQLPPETKSGVSIRPVLCGTHRFRRILQSSTKMLSAALEIDAKIYHLHDPELLPLVDKLSRKGKKVIYDSHEFYYYQIRTKRYIPSILRGFVAKLYQGYERRVLSQIDAVIAPCTINGRNYFEGIAKKTVFIDNLPWKDSFRQTDFEKKPKPMTCCCPGSLTIIRGLMETVHCSIKTGTKIILAGNYEGTLKQNLDGLLDHELLDMRGRQDHGGIQKIYDESSIGLSLIHNEAQYSMLDNFPTKVYEYMQCGIPVVMTRRPFTEKFIKKYKVGILVEAENEDEICDAIKFLKNHPVDAKAYGINGRRAIEEKYCWEREAKKLTALYDDLTGRSERQ